MRLQDSSLREFVEFRERGVHGFHRSSPVGREAERGELKRVHGYASRAYPKSGGCKESSAECTPLTRVHRQEDRHD